MIYGSGYMSRRTFMKSAAAFPAAAAMTVYAAGSGETAEKEGERMRVTIREVDADFEVSSLMEIPGIIESIEDGRV